MGNLEEVGGVLAVLERGETVGDWVEPGVDDPAVGEGRGTH